MLLGRSSAADGTPESGTGTTTSAGTSLAGQLHADALARQDGRPPALTESG